MTRRIVAFLIVFPVVPVLALVLLPAVEAQAQSAASGITTMGTIAAVALMAVALLWVVRRIMVQQRARQPYGDARRADIETLEDIRALADQMERRVEALETLLLDTTSRDEERR